MTVTRETVAEITKECGDILVKGRVFFTYAEADLEAADEATSFYRRRPIHEVISDQTLEVANELLPRLRTLALRIIEVGKFSPLIAREDIADVTTSMKTAIAALRFKSYERWDTHVLTDEDAVIGVRQAGQSEEPINLERSIQRFNEAVQKLCDIAALLVPGQPVNIVGEDYAFARMAVEEARLSEAEGGRPRPSVGVVVVKDGRVIAKAHRGELPTNHAEYIALEKKLANASIVGCTVYTTLEPCTTRNHPKIPCADRLIERKISRVVIGMLDPNPKILGRGVLRLQEANIVVELFPHDLIMELQELNREFIRTCRDSDKDGADNRLPEEIRSSANINFGSSVPDSQDTSPSPLEILAHVDSLSPYLRIAAAKSYEGLNVCWRGSLFGINNLESSDPEQCWVSVMTARQSKHAQITFWVNINEHPRLKVARQGDKVKVSGTIVGVETFRIRLVDARIEFD